MGLTLLKLLGPLAGVGILLLAARRGRLGWTTDLGLVGPPLALTAIWLVGWAAWIWVTELARTRLGMPPPTPWPAYSPAMIALRIFAIGVAGPVLEELLFRGVLYERLGRTRLGRTAAIVVLAAGWAALHTGQSWQEMGFTFVDGLILGAARRHTGSIVAPCLMHIAGNLVSIGQSLALW